MIIQAFPSGPFDTNAYVIGCSETRIAAIIDPAPNSAKEIVLYLTEHNLIPDKIILTHSHWDHIADAAALKSKYSIPIMIHELDSPNLERPGADLLPCWIPIEGVKPDHFVKDGDTINIGKYKFEVIHTPGHTPGGICLHCSSQKALMSGDTLFKGTIGNLSFPTSKPDLMWSSLKKLEKLPLSTKVFPGHGPSTTIGEEKWLSNAEKIFGNT